MKKTLGLVSASLLALAGTQANAAVLGISYSYTATAPLFTSSSTLPAVNPFATDNDASVAVPPPVKALAPIPVYGTGTIDTVAGTITLGPIDWKLRVNSGAVGFYGWSETLNGSFSGANFTHTGVTVNGGSLVCEPPAGSACASVGIAPSGPGALPLPLALDPDGIAFTSLAVGGTGQYLASKVLVKGAGPGGSDIVETYTANMEITSAVPVPAAVWLFGTGLAGLAGLARKRRA